MSGPRFVSRKRVLPTFSEEFVLRESGYSLIAGVDEVGRGPLAGPVVAGIVMLPERLEGGWVDTIRDSKQMTPTQREAVAPYLKKNALAVGIGSSSSQEIDDLGIVSATNLAVQRALNSLPLTPQFLLLDAFPIPEIDIPQKAIIKGDSTCMSIASASILAKVERDTIMLAQDIRYPGYDFAKHKGYGTPKHIQKLKEMGPSPIHRHTFAPVRESIS